MVVEVVGATDFGSDLRPMRKDQRGAAAALAEHRARSCR